MPIVQVKSLNHFWERVKSSLATPQCAVCKGPAVSDSANLAQLCESCQRHVRLNTPSAMRQTPYGDIYVACGFPMAMKQLIYGLKFSQRLQSAPVLADILSVYWRQTMLGQNFDWIVVPIPTHSPDKKSWSPVAEFARPFAHRLGYDYWPDGLVWQREVTPQHKLLSKRRRFENVHSALAVSPHLQAKLEAGANILVIDDLVTTGATMTEALNALNKCQPGRLGTTQIAGLALSHVPFALRRG